MATKGVDEGAPTFPTRAHAHTRVALEMKLLLFLWLNPCVADAIVVSRYNETRHLRAQSAALSKLASVVAHHLEAV